MGIQYTKYKPQAKDHFGNKSNRSETSTIVITKNFKHVGVSTFSFCKYLWPKQIVCTVYTPLQDICSKWRLWYAIYLLASLAPASWLTCHTYT